MNHLIEFGLKTYRLDMLTSVERIICKNDPENCKFSRYSCFWMKQFNFGGDVLSIRKYFFIPIDISIPKKHWWSSGSSLNPAWKFWDKVPSFDSYKNEFGEDKQWLDYCSYIAENTNSVKEFEFVKEQSQIVLDMLKEIDL